MPTSRQLAATIAVLLPLGTQAMAADTAAGERIFRSQCAACHSVEPGQNRTGPSLAGIVGRRSGQAAGFPYSAAARKADVTWDQTTLEKFLANPREAIPGLITHRVVRDQAQRADLVAYLATLH
jgi:cytochrome c